MEQKQLEKRKRWVTQIQPHINTSTTAVTTMMSVLEGELFGDPTWTGVLAAQLEKMRKARAALREIVPPEECREAHAMALSATLDRVLGAEYILKGVQQLDSELLLLAKPFFKSGNARMNLFRVMIEAITP